MRCRIVLWTCQQKMWWLAGSEVLTTTQFWDCDSNLIDSWVIEIIHSSSETHRSTFRLTITTHYNIDSLCLTEQGWLCFDEGKVISSRLLSLNSIDQIARKTSHTFLDLRERWELINITLHTLASLSRSRRCDVMFRIVSEFIAYLDYCELSFVHLSYISLKWRSHSIDFWVEWKWRKILSRYRTSSLVLSKKMSILWTFTDGWFMTFRLRQWLSEQKSVSANAHYAKSAYARSNYSINEVLKDYHDYKKLEFIIQDKVIVWSIANKKLLTSESSLSFI